MSRGLYLGLRNCSLTGCRRSTFLRRVSRKYPAASDLVGATARLFRAVISTSAMGSCFRGSASSTVIAPVIVAGPRSWRRKKRRAAAASTITVSINHSVIFLFFVIAYTDSLRKLGRHAMYLPDTVGILRFDASGGSFKIWYSKDERFASQGAFPT